MVGPTRPVIVLFGSSIVQYSFSRGGWGAALADSYSRQADVVLRGYERWNSRQALQVLPDVFPKDAAVQPSLVIVYFGGNDSCKPHPGTPHVPLSEYKDNMRKIGLYIKGLSEATRVIFLSCPPVSEKMLSQQLRTYEACRVYSNACIEICNELRLKDPSFQVIDLFSAIQKRWDWADTCFTDGIHFTEVASEIVVAEILKVISEANLKPSLNFGDLLTEFEMMSLAIVKTFALWSKFVDGLLYYLYDCFATQLLNFPKEGVHFPKAALEKCGNNKSN